MRPRLTYANIVATLALFIALGGASYAALKVPKKSVGTKQLKKNAVTTPKIKDQAVTAGKVKNGTLTGKQIASGSITGAQVNASTLGIVPTAQTANGLAPSEAWHLVGTPGEPPFQHSWENAGTSEDPVGFYKDPAGIVHLTGEAWKGPANNAMFQLPHGFRPGRERYLAFAVACSCTATAIDPQGGLVKFALELGRVGISGSDGRVVAENGEPFRIHLDGITFRAES
jgi:hypothetical protein